MNHRVLHQVAADLVGNTGVRTQPGIRQASVQGMGQNPAAARHAASVQKRGFQVRLQPLQATLAPDFAGQQRDENAMLAIHDAHCFVAGQWRQRQTRVDIDHRYHRRAAQFARHRAIAIGVNAQHNASQSDVNGKSRARFKPGARHGQRFDP